jgi:uracil phosphoribosyltransferase
MPLRNATTIDTQHHLKGCRAKWQPIDRILSHLNPVQILKSYFFIQNMQLKRQLQRNHVIRNINKIRGKSSLMQHFPKLPRDTRVKVTVVARPMLTTCCAIVVQVQTWCIYKQNLYSFQKIICIESVSCCL